MNVYTFVFCLLIAGGLVLQIIVTRQATAWTAPFLGALIPVPGLIVLWAFGLFAVEGLTSKTNPFGYFSMNLLSPIWPATSWVFSQTGLYIFTRGSIGGTTGQWDGYNYLGLGVLMLLGVGAVGHGTRLPRLVRDFPIIVFVAVGFTAWALSNTIYVGDFKLVSYPLPELLEQTVLAWLRNGGRFFWPVLYLLVALAIAGALRVLPGRLGVAVAAVALVAQWADTSIWRGRVDPAFTQPAESQFAPHTAWLQGEVQRTGMLVTIPPVFCSEAGSDYMASQNLAVVEAQLIAAKANASKPDVFTARNNPRCDKPGLDLLARHAVLVIVGEAARGEEMLRHLSERSCRAVPAGLVCPAAP